MKHSATACTACQTTDVIHAIDSELQVPSTLVRMGNMKAPVPRRLPGSHNVEHTDYKGYEGKQGN